MKEILKSKSDIIRKLFIYNIAMSLFGVFVVSPFTDIPSLMIGASVFSILFYISLVSYAVIEDGQKDCISCSSGRIAGRWYTGLVYSVAAYLPTIVIVLLHAILKSLGVLESLVGILNLLIRFFFMGSFLGLDSGLAPYKEVLTTHQRAQTGEPGIAYTLSDHGLIFVLCLVVIPLVCTIVYSLSLKGIIHVDTTPKKDRVRKSKKNKDSEE